MLPALHSSGIQHALGTTCGLARILHTYLRTNRVSNLTQAILDPRTARIHQHGLRTTFVIRMLGVYPRPFPVSEGRHRIFEIHDERALATRRTPRCVRNLFLFLCLRTHLSTNYILRPHKWALRYAYTACDDFSDSENPYCSPLTNARVHCAIVTDLYVPPRL